MNLSSTTNVSYNLDQFVDKAYDLYQAEDHRDFIRFVVNGKLGSTQVVVDPIQHRLRAHQPISQFRDYDSLIGLCANIVVRRSIFIYPVANPRDTLTENLHIHYSIKTTQNDFTAVPLHKIPNIMFAKWDDRNMIRVIFPGLWSTNRRSPQLNKEEQTQFYELGLRPAIVELDQVQGWQWPATYDNEIARARLRNGQMTYSQKQWGKPLVRELGDAIREQLRRNGVEWAEGLLFLHNIRGTKVGTEHLVYEQCAVAALREFLEEVSLSTWDMARGYWFIDVGLSINAFVEEEAGETQFPCLQWRTDSHSSIVGAALGIDNASAARMTSFGSSQYSRDHSSHLTAVSGFRLEPTRNRWDAVYIQAYTMEKELTYNPQGPFHGMAFTCQQAMTANNPFCDNLYDIYTDSILKCSSRARLEVRVPFDHATRALLYFGQDDNGEESRRIWDLTLRGSLLAIERISWWSLRAYRLLAFNQLLVMQREAPGRDRTHSKALCLTAILVMAINSLHSSMLEGSAMRSLLDKSLPCLQRADIQDPSILAYPTSWGQNATEGTRKVPIIQHGLLFLRDLKYPPEASPHFSGQGEFSLSPEAMQFFFQMDLEGLKRKYDSLDIIRRSDIPAERINTRVRTTPMYNPIAADADEQPESFVTHIFNFGEQGLSLRRSIEDEDKEDEDNEDGGSDFGEEEDEDGPWVDLDTVMDSIWRQFFVDLLVKCPNPVGLPDESHCKLTLIQRSSAEESIFKNDCVSDIFRKCQYRIGKKAQWEIAFKHLWPEKNRRIPEKIQGYRQSRYWNKWRKLMRYLDVETAEEVRQKVWERFSRNLFWVPSAAQDKMWPSSRSSTHNMLPPNLPPGAAPQILVRSQPKWD